MVNVILTVIISLYVSNPLKYISNINIIQDFEFLQSIPNRASICVL